MAIGTLAPATVSASVDFEGVTKRFGAVTAVDNLTLAVREGELMVLLGPSGCGKTTTLRLLAGLEKPTSGSIRIGDVVVNELPPRSRNIAMVFQSYALYPHLKVRDNLAYPLKIRHTPRREIEQRVAEIANLLQIDELLERRPRQLSGGQRQRVALGRALIRQPNVFLMDEPLSNLDATLRVYMRGQLKHLQAELGITSVYVTHDQAEAMTLADRIAIMNQGVLRQVDTPERIHQRPANTFVAGFLGSPSMNFLDGQLVAQDGRLAVAIDADRHPVGARLAAVAARAPTPEARLGVRPEDVDVAHGAAPGWVPAEVYVVEAMGHETLVTVRYAGQLVMARTHPDFTARIGDTAWVRFDPEKVHLFERSSGRSLDAVP